MAGEYESYRGILTATVEREGATLDVTLETAGDEQHFTATPETADPDDFRYTVVREVGAEVPVEFERTDEGMDLYFERWRLHRTA